jgi:hypothetical protein
MSYILQVHRNLVDRERGEREGDPGDLETPSRRNHTGRVREGRHADEAAGPGEDR